MKGQHNCAQSNIYYINERNSKYCMVTKEYAEQQRKALEKCVKRMSKKWEKVWVAHIHVSCGGGEQAIVYGEGRKQ